MRLELASLTLIYSCINIPLYEALHDIRPFSVTSEAASETQNHLTLSYWVPEHQGTGYSMRTECMKLVLVSFTLIYTYCQLHVCLRGVHVLREALKFGMVQRHALYGILLPRARMRSEG